MKDKLQDNFDLEVYFWVSKQNDIPVRWTSSPELCLKDRFTQLWEVSSYSQSVISHILIVTPIA
jgi:hypothetical protein